MRSELPTFKEVRGTLRRWFNPTALSAARLRDVLVGVVVTVGLAEVGLFRLLRHRVVAGDLPEYTTDVLIVVLCAVEALAAPLASWWGYRTRRRALLVWAALVTVCLATWFLLTTPEERPLDLCTASASTAGSTGGAAVLLLSGPVLMVARTAVWSHGVAYLEDHVPDHMPLHYSVFVLARALPPLIGAGLVSLIDSSVPGQVAMFVVGMSLNVLQLMTIVPKQDPEVDGEVKPPPPMDDRGFLASVSRVVRRPLVVAQLLALALLVSALWGYGYYRTDIFKVKYHMEVQSNFIKNFSDIQEYMFVLVVVVFTGMYLCPPVTRYSPAGTARVSLLMTALALSLLLLLLTMTGCELGQLAGVGAPLNCSSQCGCEDRWLEFSPVCVLDQLTTYPTPCHAGCSSQDLVNGISVLACACGRAAAGACGAAHCHAAYQLHEVLLPTIAAAVIVGASGHGVVALRAADARDRAVTMGVGSAVVALVVGVTHTYLAVATDGMCALTAGGSCVVPTTGLPTLVGISSAVLMVASTLISLGTWLRLRRKAEACV